MDQLDVRIVIKDVCTVVLEQIGGTGKPYRKSSENLHKKSEMSRFRKSEPVSKEDAVQCPRAPVRLISRLKNQRELTKTAEFEGEKLYGPDEGLAMGWEAVKMASK
jgi:hypothetical protein